MLKSKSGDVPGMFSGLSVVQFSWCMSCTSGNREILGLKINFANAKLNKGFERQRQIAELLLL